MKITAFNGSPRGKKSNTHFMVENFLRGAEEAGADIENVFLVKNKIKHCMGCFSCWIKTPGKCVINDDMHKLLDKYVSSDVVVYASPVYVGSVTGIMKDFLDRSLPLAEPWMKKNKRGEYRHPDRYEKHPSIVLISNSGFPGMSPFKYFRNIFTFLEENSGEKIIGEIYRPAGPMLEVNSPQLKPVIENYKKLLRKAGREVVENGKLSAGTRTELEKPFIDHDEYVNIVNKYWDDALGKLESSGV